MRTRRWLVILAAHMLLAVCGGALAGYGVYGHPNHPAVAVTGGAFVVMMAGAMMWFAVSRGLPLARFIDNQSIPRPCHMGRAGRVVHVPPYCRCGRREGMQ